MNLNDKLCKCFDAEKKGYVNIGDVLFLSLLYGVIAAVLCGLMYSFYQGLLIIISGNILDPTYQVSDINELIGAFGLAILLIIVVIIFTIMVVYICKIRIAKCDVNNK